MPVLWGPIAKLSSVLGMLEAVTDLHLNGSLTRAHACDVLDIVLDPLSCSTRLFTSGAMHACHDLRTLAMFPRPEVLSIGAISIHTCHKDPFVIPSPFYPSLRELKLQGLDSKMCSYVLRHLSFPSNLVSFDLDATKEDRDGFECTLLMQ